VKKKMRKKTKTMITFKMRILRRKRRKRRLKR